MTEKYIIDLTLGRLGRWLRLLGIDVEVSASSDMAELIERASHTSRRVITRRRHHTSRFVVHIRSNSVEEQIVEFFTSEGLEAEREKFFTRCALCNTLLSSVDKESAAARGVPEYVLFASDTFFSCGSCLRVYWSGSHKNSFLDKVRSLKVPLKKRG